MKTNTVSHMSRLATGIIAAGMPLMIAELHAQATPDEKDKDMHHDKMMMDKPSYSKLVALIRPVGDSNVKGTVVFEKVDDGVKVTADIGGLKPNSKHGFHIHEFGDLGSEDASSAGDHFNPEGHPHAMPDNTSRHAGDLGNLEADANGAASMTLTVKNLNLCAGPTGILGRAVIVHSKEDDGSQPSGNSGDRIGAGVIGVSKDAKVEAADKDKRMKKDEHGMPDMDASEHD